MTVKKDGKTYKLREDFQRAQVVVLVNDQAVFRSGEYRTAAEHLKHQHGLSDGELATVYRDYKNDFDRG